MSNPLSRAAAIVGAAEADEIGFLAEPKSSLQLHVEAIKNVSEQTGIPLSRVDGVFSTGWSSELCEHLGLQPKYIDTTACGGCSFEMHVHHALAAIHSGIIDVALVSHGENGFSSRKIGAKGRPSYGPGSGDASPALEMTAHYGIATAPSAYAHAMVRHMHQYGTHLTVTAQGAGGDRVVFDEDYSFDDQRHFPLAPELKMKAGERVRVDCTYKNTTSESVGFGDSSLQEMCFAGLFTYPASSGLKLVCTQ